MGTKNENWSEAQRSGKKTEQAQRATENTETEAGQVRPQIQRRGRHARVVQPEQQESLDDIQGRPDEQ